MVDKIDRRLLHCRTDPDFCTISALPLHDGHQSRSLFHYFSSMQFCIEVFSFCIPSNSNGSPDVTIVTFFRCAMGAQESSGKRQQQVIDVQQEVSDDAKAFKVWSQIHQALKNQNQQCETSICHVF